MKILTFDTSLNKTYITYGEDENIIFYKALLSDKEKYHSAYLIPELLNLLKEQNITFRDIEAIGINEGPGSFTGIRICTVIARTAAQQIGSKIVPVASLEILSKINNSDKKTLVLLDARKNKVYAAAYDCCGKVIKSPHSVPIEALQDLISSDDFEIITDSVINKLLAEKNIKSINYEEGNFELGKYLYKIVFDKLNTKSDFHWAKAKPLYIQPPSITLSKKVGV